MNWNSDRYNYYGQSQSGHGGRIGDRERTGGKTWRSQSPKTQRGGGRKTRHPPGLQGKEIGLYYARLNKEKQKEERENRKKKLRVVLAEDRQREIWKLLGNTEHGFTEPQQELTSVQCSSSISGDLFDGYVKRNSDTEAIPSASKYEHIADSAFKRQFLQNLEGNRRATLGPAELVRTALERDADLDRILQQELESYEHNTNYLDMQFERARLPAAAKKAEILEILSKNQVVVISGETGCGKTTQVPQYILDDAIESCNGSLCRVVCTQPRRISAISVAQRVADERCEHLGRSTGYQIRLECCRPRDRGSILYCTTGILIQWLQTDPCLEQVSHLIIDEIHERDILSDFVLTVMKDLLPHRPELKLILMSATLNAASFSRYYNDCPMLNIPGVTFPVQTYYLEDALQMTGFQFPEAKAKPGEVWKKHTGRGRTEERKKQEYMELMEPYVKKLRRDDQHDPHVLQSLLNPLSEEINLDFITALLQYVCNTQPDGAILVFLPGWDHISKLYNQVTDMSFFTPARYRVLPLHSALPTVNQREIFLRPPAGVRKIIIATNIAETSITIDDVVYVIDCGRIKLTNYDVQSNLQTLSAEWVSLANAVQRRGRAGRVQAGVCFHLFSRRREMTLAPYQLPEMLRSRLEEVILQLKILKLGSVRPFLSKVLDPPDPLAVDKSIELLVTLNALDKEENLTPLGFHLARLPMDPQTGKMLLMGALFSCLDPILTIAASLSHKDAFVLPLGRERQAEEKKLELSKGLKSDHLVFVEAMRLWEEAERNNKGRDFCWEYFLSSNTLVMLRNMKQQLAEHLEQLNFVSSSNPKSPDCNVNSSNLSLVKAIVCAGLYPNVATVSKVKRNRTSGRVFIRMDTPEDGRVELHLKSVNAKQAVFESPYLLYHLKLKSSSIFLHDSTMVYPLPLLFFGGPLKTKTDANNGEHILAMDTLQFYSSPDTSQLLQELRRRLDLLLEHKVTHPGKTDWTKNSTERALLLAIVELITTEDRHNMLQSEQCSDDDCDD